MKIKKDTRVQYGENLTPGIVERVIHGDETIVVVRLDNNDLVKCYPTDLTIIVDEPTKDTFNRYDFDEAVKKVLDPSNFECLEEKSRMIAEVAGETVIKLLRRELFGGR